MYKKKVWVCLISIFLCLIFGQTIQFVPYERFYLGVFIALGLIGWVHWVEVVKKIDKRWFLVQKVLIYITTLALFAISFTYAYPMVRYVFINQNRTNFLVSKVGSLRTIMWANSHLPSDSFMIIEGGSRYFYDIKTELNHILFWKKMSKFNRQKHPKKVIRFLKANGVTHLMTLEHPKQIRKDWYYKLCQNPLFLKLVYENKNEIISGRRVLPDIYGAVSVYEIL